MIIKHDMHVFSCKIVAKKKGGFILPLLP